MPSKSFTESQGRKARREARVDALLTMSQAEVDDWIDNNINATASGLQNMRKALKVLSRVARAYMEDRGDS